MSQSELTKRAVACLQCDYCGGNFEITNEKLIECLECRREVLITDDNVFQFEKTEIPDDALEKTMYGPEKDELREELLHFDSNYRLLKKILGPNAVSLDYGCGSSRQVFDLAKINKAEIIFGLDFDYKPLKISSELAKEVGVKNIFFIQYRSDKLPFRNNIFDLVTSHQALEHLINPEKVVKNLSQKMKAGCLFEVDFPNGHSLGESMRSLFHHLVRKRNPHLSRINLARAREFFSRAGLAENKFYPDQIFSGPILYIYEGFILRFVKKEFKLWSRRRKIKENYLFKKLVKFERIFSRALPRCAHNFSFILTKN